MRFREEKLLLKDSWIKEYNFDTEKELWCEVRRNELACLTESNSFDLMVIKKEVPLYDIQHSCNFIKKKKR